MTLSPADSPANQSASPEPDSPKMIRGGFGPSLSESFAWYDPDMLSWKTSQGSLLLEWATYSETWPRAGMTVSGKAFRLPLLAPRIYGGESSSWPTPMADDANQRNRDLARRIRDKRQIQLADAVRMWPTPAAQEAGGSDEWLETLETVDGQPARIGERQYDPATGKHTQIGLARAVRLHTPTSKANQSSPSMRDRDPGSWGTTGQLNPMWVEWLMGFPEGWTDLEDSATP